MKIVWGREQVTVRDVYETILGRRKVAYTTVLTMLRILEEKGHIRHREDGPRYVYLPVVGAEAARRSALRHVLDTFFEGSAAGAMAALLGGDGGALSPEELARMEGLIAKARKGGA